MKHAGAKALDRLEPLLVLARGCSALREKSRGVFYFRSKAFLHFHEDPAGLFADMRGSDGEGFDRVRVDDSAGAQTFVKRLEAVAGSAPVGL